LTLRAFARRKLVNPIDVARDGEEALDYFKRWDEGEKLPVVILLDLKLPKISGLELLEKIKKHPKYNSIPVVILTTSKAEEDIVKSYSLYANCYVTKPVDLEQFVKVVKSIEDFWLTIVKLPQGKTP